MIEITKNSANEKCYTHPRCTVGRNRHIYIDLKNQCCSHGSKLTPEEIAYLLLTENFVRSDILSEFLILSSI